MDAVSHGIQMAVAPVFMLTAVAGLIGALANRLARIVDRVRVLEGWLRAGTAPDEDAAYWELDRLRLRGNIVNWSVGLLTLSATLIAMTVIVLFLGELNSPGGSTLVPWSFMGGVLCFLLALLCFLLETVLSTHAVRHGMRRPGR